MINGFVLAGARSGVGKTTLSMGLMASFEDVSPFKVGPDYIDPSFHKFVTGNNSYNLDLFLMGEDGVKYTFSKNAKSFAIVEGVMGLYDGLGNDLNNFSTAHVAKTLNLPVILVVDSKGKSTSIAAEVLGYKLLDKDVNIAGVIINNVNSEKLYLMLKDAVEKYTNIPCLGYLKTNKEIAISSRHLGLLQADEVDNLKENIELLKNELKQTIDLEKIKEISKGISLPVYKDIFKNLNNKYRGIKVGIARDSAFSFYYQDNIELLERMGVEILYFSPLKDKKIPNTDILYFGGGYPENYMEVLNQNISFINSLKEFHSNGGIIFGECGGFMYLSSGIRSLDGEFYKMTELLDCTVKMTNRLNISRFGYVNIEFGDLKGKAHEFHYSGIEIEGNTDKVFKVLKNDGREWACGYKNKNLIAGYPHLHFFKSLDIILNILEGVKR